MLRNIFVGAIILIGLRYSFKGAFYTLLFYLWIARFRPDTWLHGDWITPIWLSFTVGVAVVVSTAFSKEPFRFGLGPALLLALLILSLISTIASPAPRLSAIVWWEFARIFLISYALIVLVTTEKRLRLALTVVAFSLGFEGTKQGWVTLILHPGAVNTNRFEFLGDNNGVAVGMLMLVPLVTALARTSSSVFERFVARFFAIGVLYRAISTYSRGGFLASLVLGAHYLIRSRLRPGAIVGLVLAGCLIIPALPQEFWDRMESIRAPVDVGTDDRQGLTKEEVSSTGRLHFWAVAVRMASDRPFVGVGMHVYNQVYDSYDSTNGLWGRRRSVHSSWFGMLAELGYIGFGLFVGMFVYAFSTTIRARRLAKTHPHLRNLAIYAGGLEGALIVFVVGGAFITFQYNELVWHFLALTVVVRRLVDEGASQAPEVLRLSDAPQITGVLRQTFAQPRLPPVS